MITPSTVRVHAWVLTLPGIMDFREKPDHQRCVAIVTRAALKEMRFPGVLCIVLPVATGLAARFVGEATNRPLLGAQVRASPRPHNPVLHAPAAAHADRPLQPDHRTTAHCDPQKRAQPMRSQQGLSGRSIYSRFGECADSADRCPKA